MPCSAADSRWRRLRAEGPLLMLAAAAFAAPPLILWQGGSDQQGFVAFCAVLATPMLAIETMTTVLRVGLQIEAGPR